MFLAVIWALMLPPIKQREISKIDGTNENTSLLENDVKIILGRTKTFVKDYRR